MFLLLLNFFDNLCFSHHVCLSRLGHGIVNEVLSYFSGWLLIEHGVHQSNPRCTSSSLSFSGTNLNIQIR